MKSADGPLGLLEGGLKDETLAPFIARTREELRARNPHTLASLCGVDYDPSSKLFSIRVLDKNLVMTYPDFVAWEASGERHEATPWLLCLLLYYFRTANGAPLTGQWVSYRELPDGMFYHQAFQGYSGDRLARGFGNDLTALETAAQAIGARKGRLGDLSFIFDALPRVPICLIYWLGDDDFPPTAKVVFDSSASNYLPTDVLAGVGARLCGLLLDAAGKRA